MNKSALNLNGSVNKGNGPPLDQYNNLESVLGSRKNLTPIIKKQRSTTKVSRLDNNINLIVNPERDMFNTPLRATSPSRPNTAYKHVKSKIDTQLSPAKNG